MYLTCVIWIYKLPKSDFFLIRKLFESNISAFITSFSTVDAADNADCIGRWLRSHTSFQLQSTEEFHRFAAGENDEERRKLSRWLWDIIELPNNGFMKYVTGRNKVYARNKSIVIGLMLWIECQTIRTSGQN